MARAGTYFIAILIFGLCTVSKSDGAMRSLDELPLNQRFALQESERRLETYDRALLALDDARKSRKINRQEFTDEDRDLTAFIAAEARFQNDLLTKDSGFAENAREVMQNIAKYAIEIPAYILVIVANGAAGSSYSFSP